MIKKRQEKAARHREKKAQSRILKVLASQASSCYTDKNVSIPASKRSTHVLLGCAHVRTWPRLVTI